MIGTPIRRRAAYITYIDLPDYRRIKRRSIDKGQCPALFLAHAVTYGASQ